jgi:DNA-binding MarR family transcriptional regulator
MGRDGLDERDGAEAGSVELGPLGELVGYRLRRAQLAVFADFVAALAGLELRPATFGVLAVLERNPGSSQAAIGDALGIQRANFVALAGELERRGLVARAPSRLDRRQNVLRLTGAGRRLVGRAWTVVQAHESRITAGLQGAEVERLRGLLGRIEDFAHAAGATAVPARRTVRSRG